MPNTPLDFELAKELSSLKRNQNYRSKDPNISWLTFLASRHLTPNKAYRFIIIHETYIEKLGLKPEQLTGLDTNVLMRLSKIVTKENVSDWLAKVKTFPRETILRKIRYGEVEEAKCEHAFIIKKVCKFCGKKEITK